MANTKFAPCGNRACAIKVYSYEDRIPRGTIENPNFEQVQVFESLTELLLLMDSLFDDIGNPQRTMEPRCELSDLTNLRGSRDTEFRGEPAAAFLVDVMFRQNASWQGSFDWTDRKKDTTFRSVLEFISIMDGVLDATERTAASQEPA